MMETKEGKKLFTELEHEQEIEILKASYEKEKTDMREMFSSEKITLLDKIDELRKENEVLKLKWSVIEMIFKN